MNITLNHASITTTSEINTLKKLPFIFPAVGAILVGLSLFFAFQSYQAVSNGNKVEGIVIEMIRRRDSDGDVTYAPLVTYTDLSGKKQEYYSNVSSNPPRFQENQTVELLINPSNPKDIKINSFMDLYFPSLILGGIGTGFILLSLKVLSTQKQFQNIKETANPVIAPNLPPQPAPLSPDQYTTS